MGADPELYGIDRRQAQIHVNTAALHLAQHGDGGAIADVSWSNGRSNNARILRTLHQPIRIPPPLVGAQRRFLFPYETARVTGALVDYRGPFLTNSTGKAMPCKQLLKVSTSCCLENHLLNQ